MGSLDFGSGSVKSLVVEVDLCEKTIGKVLFQESFPTNFNESLQKSKSDTISEETLTKYSSLFKQISEKVRSHQAEKVYAVGTSAFRTAKNGEHILQEISKIIETPIELVSQDKEAELGYWSALVAKNLPASAPAIVWDIGGGSLQIFTKKDGQVFIHKGNLAAVTFKNAVIKDIQKKDIVKTNSPNPLGKDWKKATKLAYDYAEKNVPSFFKQNKDHYQWIGVGGVLAISVQEQINANAKSFTRSELEETLKVRSQLKDSQIKSEYKTTDISSLALVLGYMQSLDIKQIETVKVNLGHGLIYEKLHSH